ncbi:MAG: sarcosine oxidase subunit gamma family protein [Pseudomonadota bacterium]
MSEAVSALQGPEFEGLVTVREAGLQGMITIRGDLSAAELSVLLRDAAGLDVPETLKFEADGERTLAWMAPDEMLLLTGYGEAEDLANALATELEGTHALIANVSDARVMFTLEGPAVREVLAKLTPADVSAAAFSVGTFRRTRLAQVAAALWMTDEATAHVVAFRSVAQYVFDLLQTAARPGSEVAFFR